MSSVYFPLRSSVEFFAGSAEVDPANRVKAAAILFDKVIFEAGQILVSIGDSMNFEIYRHRHEVADEDLKHPRLPAGPGEEVELTVAGKTLGDTTVQRTYAAQWHTAAIDQLEALQVPWASYATPAQSTRDRLREPTELTGAEFAQRALGGELSPPQVDYAAKALAGDAVLAAHLGAAINVSPMFIPFAGGEKVKPMVTGSDALSLTIPDLERLSWESIAEYRERPGSVEARGLLRGFEEAALSQEPGDVADYLAKISSEVTGAFLSALADTEVSIPKVAAREAASVAAGFVPILGPVIGPAAGVAGALGQRAEQRESGVLALASLRRTT